MKISIQSGPMTRSREIQKRYIKESISKKKKDCSFCAFSISDGQVIKEYKHFWLVKNIYPYIAWDGCEVTEHNMLVPKRHMLSLSKLHQDEAAEYVKIINDAEGNGYSLYTRSNSNITKSIPHVHTHFIKIADKRIKSLFYIRKPHILWFR